MTDPTPSDEPGLRARLKRIREAAYLYRSEQGDPGATWVSDCVYYADLAIYAEGRASRDAEVAELKRRAE